MISKHMICPERKRRLPQSFSWLDHRLARSGHLKKCDSDALGLYLFLVIVGDADGLSYYSDASMCALLPLTEEKLPMARKTLINVGLIVYEVPLYQVLGLDYRTSKIQITAEKEKGKLAPSRDFPRSGSGHPQSIEDIVKKLLSGEQS